MPEEDMCLRWAISSNAMALYLLSALADQASKLQIGAKLCKICRP